MPSSRSSRILSKVFGLSFLLPVEILGLEFGVLIGLGVILVRIRCLICGPCVKVGFWVLRWSFGS